MNNQEIKYASPGDTLLDDVVTGLSLRCLATKKSWSLYYRIGGQQRRPTIGTYPTLSISDAREVARGILKQVAMGADPSADKQGARSAPTMCRLWDEYARYAGGKKTAAEDARIWEKYAAPAVSALRVAAVSLECVRQVHADLSATPYQANRVLALLSSMMNHAEALGWRPNGSNPCRHVKRFKEQKRRRYMAPAEARAVADALNRYAETQPAAVAFVYLLILTGARKSEIAGARWDQVHPVGNRLVLTEHKTDGNGSVRTIHLPAQALDLLAKLPRNRATLTGIQDPKKLWGKVRAEAGCPDLRLHDLRHSFASAALSAGLTLGQIGELLCHSSVQTTSRYAHLMHDAAGLAVNQTADVLAGMMKG